MGNTASWRKAACLWPCILLPFKRICFEATFQAPFLMETQYTCYDGDFLCPVLNGEPTLRCGPDCFLPEQYS
jgi:Carbohydrate binding